MKYDFLNSLDLEKGVIFKISSLLDRINRGSDNILVSPICSDSYPELLLYAWDSIFNAKIYQLSDDLLHLETLNREKFGPRSLATNWNSRRDSVLDYFSRDNTLNVPVFKGVLPRCLRPIDVDNALDFLKNSTNSGLPFYQKKGDVKDILRSEFASLLARRDDCLLFTRTQEGLKTRTVWGYPCADTLNEMRFYRPLLQYQRRLSWRTALLGPEAIDLKMTQLIRDARSLGQSILSVDFSSYDASVKTGLQSAAFDYIRSLFQSDCYSDLEYIQERFNTIGLITPDGILGGPHGVPSGSTFTNEVDSIVQYLCALTSGMESDQFDIQGDDGVYRLTDPNLLKGQFSKFGLSVNDEKSYISDDSAVYLQSLFSVDHASDDGIIRGVYPTYRALSRIIYPERFDTFRDDDLIGADYYSIKTISILENCKNHPLFYDLVKFIAKFDRYNLRYTQHGLQSFIQRRKKTSGAEGLILNKPGDVTSGFNQFETVKILSELYPRTSI